MPKASPLQSNFNGGEFSPLVGGRVDADRYKTGLAKCLNYIPTIQGGLTRRPGSMFVAEVKDSSKSTRLVRFEFSTTQAYMIEFGDLYTRFYRDNGQITESTKVITGVTQANPGVVTSAAHGFSNGDEVFINGVVGMTELNNRNFKISGVAANTFNLLNMDGTNFNTTALTAYVSGGTVARVYTLTTTYAAADLFNLNFVQSQDVLYIFHPAYVPRKLTRTAHTSWTITDIAFLDGPYLPENQTAITLTPSGVNGAITLTASAALWVSTDVGRVVRIYVGAWSWCLITGYTSSTVVNATVRGVNLAVAAWSRWRLGIFSTTTGYPACGVFHEDRLTLAGSPLGAQRLDMSVSGDYENFSPTESDSTVPDNKALSFTLNSNDVNVVRWLISSEKALLAGTVAGEWAIRPSVQSEAISPSNVNAKQVTSYGSANVQPVTPGESTLFIQRSKRKVREITYYYEKDGFRSPDRTVIGEHIAGQSGIKQMAHQKEPQSIVWCCRNDGVLAGMTYERDDDTLIVGWHRHIIGGYSDAANSAAIVESVAVIPSSDGSRDDLWVIVKRRINGGTKRYIEYVTPIFDDFTEQRDAFFVDGGLTYDAPVNITGVTRANPCVVTAVAHGFSNGDAVLITGIVGNEDENEGDITGMTELNTNTYTVRNKTADTFELEDVSGNPVNSTAFSAYVSGGEVRKYVTTITGLWHLEGQTISVLSDGAVQPSKTVSGGSITLSTRGTTVHLGFSYNSDGQMLRLEAGSADGTALGKTRRTHKIGIYFHRSLGLKIGVNFTNLQELTFRTSADPLTRAPGLYSGIRSETLEADYDLDNQVSWRTSQPLPSTILAIAPQLHTEDAA